jgi:hypothetical protein
MGTSSIAVPGKLPADRGRRPAQSDLFPLTKGQVTPLQVAPAARAYATGLTHPCQTPPTVGAGDGRGFNHELTALPRGPERLD